LNPGQEPEPPRLLGRTVSPRPGREGGANGQGTEALSAKTEQLGLGSGGI